MRYYGCLLALAACCPQLRGGSAPRVVYRIETVAGSSLIGDQGPAAAAQISNIQGLAADRFGNLYLSDTDHHRVRKVSPAGIITTVAGTGAAGYGGDGGPAAAAQLNLPYGLAVDTDGNLYIADFGNLRVRKVSAADGAITTVAGNGQKASAPDGVPAAGASLFSPRNVAVDAAGLLYISEYEGHRVRKVGADGKLATAAGSGQAGYRGDGSAGSLAQLNYPAGLAVDRDGALYIADSGNNRIRKVYAGGTIGTVLGGSSSTALATPIAVAVDQLSTMYVADSSFVVRCYTTAGKWSDAAGNGGPGFSGDGGSAVKASLNAVHELAAAPNGGFYIADGIRVRFVNSNGAIQTVAGDAYTKAVGDGMAATSAILAAPSGVALDWSGNLFVADAGTQRVRQVAPAGTIATLAGTGTAALGGEGIAANTSPLNSPFGVAVDPFGNILIADSYNHRIRQVAADRKIRTVAGVGTGGNGLEGFSPLATMLRGPRGVCTDRGNNLYIADTANHRMLRVPPGGTVQIVAGNGSAGDGGDGGVARLAQLNQPMACQLDSWGNLYLADTFNNRVRKVSPGGTISTVAGDGIAGYGGDEGPALSARLSQPMGIAVDDSGDVFIADSGNHRVRLVTPDGIIHTIAGTGSAGFSGDGAAAAEAQLNAPAGIFLDGSGALYVADSGNNRVRRLLPDSVLPPDPIVQPPTISVVNAMSSQGGAVAPGEIVTIFGSGLGPVAGVPGTLDAAGLLSNLLAGVEVRFDGVAAPLFYVQYEQINAQVPYTVAGRDATHVEVRQQGKTVASIDLPVVAAAPALLPVIVNQDGSLNSDTAPAPPGTVLTLYATGEGLTNGPNVSGKPAGAEYTCPLLPVELKISGISSELLFACSAPGLVGAMQINARVPGGFVPSGKSEAELRVGGTAGPPVTLWLK